MQLVQLLADLLPDPIDRRPVPAHGAGPLLDLAAGRQRGQGDAANGDCSPASRRSSALIASQLRSTSAASATSTSPNTWGWRRTILAPRVRYTSVRSKAASSAASWACRITCRKRSPAPPPGRRRSLLDGVDHLVGLLQHEGTQAGVRLAPIPRAAVGGARRRARWRPCHAGWPGCRAAPARAPASRPPPGGVGQPSSAAARRSARRERVWRRVERRAAARAACGAHAGRAGRRIPTMVARSGAASTISGRAGSNGMPARRSALATCTPSAGSMPAAGSASSWRAATR